MVSEIQSFIESQLSSGSFSVYSFFFLALGGLLAGLLPCVYPLYPITAGILKSRVTNHKWSHPFVYYVGLASMYAVFGLIAGLSGGAFNSFLRYPETQVILAILLFVLGLSVAEFLYFPFFAGDLRNSENVSYANTFFLGVGAGLLSSPCVGPVVVSILVQLIAYQTEGISLFPILFTSLKMFVFGLGLGIPFLLIGVFGFALPKSGKWMKAVQWILALMILYFSFTYLEKAFVLWSFDSLLSIKVFFLWSLALVFLYLQKKDGLPHEKMKLALLQMGAFTSFIILLLLLQLSLWKLEPGSSHLKTNSAPVEVHGNLEWHRTEADVYRIAKETRKPIFIDFYADWCTNCKEFQKLTISHKEWNETFKSNAILWKVYDTDPIFEEFADNPNYPELKIGLPFFLILDADGKMIYKSNDYLDTKGMIEAVKKL
ncbi:thioredoxin family protein [Leptospira sp. 2 VSF19]|uniref:Thioredoxin family protein n=1 Tax=Leptospira soteropolitanensis TaxID=2950025 RepID=A0AAW5VJ43_9LEPT|nr:cytochrome c biogenesis protein CcdA [Leptospira soteropolitanensis]MCW7491376.1 thioredoxin family protein [Leptospira soteropolitanensis]MCW7498961.1 thioredoxin family protein [Leptospira soteropolitanensis]MCW7521447.1 thioredoxin family protein [Leptospira soteropolitanensis]MCW7525064.1 thioredoxin family protein [Leptospira soteropolitanensis]MCW7528932.1 thioredoxin family protein [Leptospira soteropolitanensis]